MAWGYWSATTVSDRGRSPRRNQNGATNSAASTTTHHYYHQQQQQQQQSQQTQQLDDRPSVAQIHQTTINTNLNNNLNEFEDVAQFTRRPSLDLNLIGPQGALAGILCSAHSSKQGSNGSGGTLSAGNTLTRIGSKHTAVEYAVPHHLYHQYHSNTSIGGNSGGPGGGTSSTTTYIEYHHKQLSFSDDDSSSEPGYATVFPNVPPQPGMPCQGEDRSIYRRGARRWRKLYRVNGHIFQAKRFNRRAFCAFCDDRIWGLGRQGFKCIQCKLLVHKKCHKLVQKPCTVEIVEPLTSSSTTTSATNTLRSDHLHHHHHHHHNNGESPLITSSSNAEILNELREQREYIEQLPTNQELEESVPVEDPNNRNNSGGGDDDLEPGTQRQYSLNDFELIRVIGRGSYAKVLMVELKKTKRIYAMKVIKKALVTDDEDIDWVQTEKHVFETASNHPFLVGLHSCFQTPSRLFFVIEFVRGGDLMFHMQRQRRLPEEHARFYAAEISLALNFLHCKGIIYRDLKLDNVLLDHEGHIKLTDYGMCKEGIRAGDTTSTFCGTPNYIAPEILRGEDYGFSVDWWALGVLLYEMLAGRSPFDIAGASENPDQNTEDYLFQVILEKTIRIPRSLSVKAANVLKGFLNKNPADRLGCHSHDSFNEITSHQFFKSIDWDMLEQKQVPPPYKPRLDSDRDLANFPPEFTDEPVHLTPDDPHIIEKIDQSEFEGFEYVNPLLMSLEDCV